MAEKSKSEVQSGKHREAMLYERLDGQTVRCHLCGHECKIVAGQYGVCRVRENVEGRLETLNYDWLVAANVDPIEKKPLYHFLPGSWSMSVAAAGCNFQCAFCQNWQISQLPRQSQAERGERVSPERIVQSALEQDCQSISYTYTEPTIFFELAYDTAKEARRKGLKNVFVSNGYLTSLAVKTIAPYLDAINVDLKAFRDETYKRIMKASLEPVLTCLRALAAEKIWAEVTTLVVPEMNDSDGELRDIANFIAQELSPDVPWHISRFHGDYQMTGVPATPMERLERAYQIGKEAGLRYVYVGNISGGLGSDTFCPRCNTALVQRSGFTVRANQLRDGACVSCGLPIAGVWA